MICINGILIDKLQHEKELFHDSKVWLKRFAVIILQISSQISRLYIFNLYPLTFTLKLYLFTTTFRLSILPFPTRLIT